MKDGGIWPLGSLTIPLLVLLASCCIVASLEGGKWLWYAGACLFTLVVAVAIVLVKHER